jgi:eukaryotic-like serine/threonine-protein kinase
MNVLQLNEEAIFHVARRIADPEARVAYLEQVSGGDAALRRRVVRLLRACEQEASFLEVPACDATIDVPVPTERPGTVIGPYRLLEQIGEGGMGVVFMAEQSQPVRRKVALKVIKPGMDTKQVIARFEAERQALALMDHPNIARVLDAGTTESGRPYFVMELVRGGHDRLR